MKKHVCASLYGVKFWYMMFGYIGSCFGMDRSGKFGIRTMKIWRNSCKYARWRILGFYSRNSSLATSRSWVICRIMRIYPRNSSISTNKSWVLYECLNNSRISRSKLIYPLKYFNFRRPPVGLEPRTSHHGASTLPIGKISYYWMLM